MIGEGDPLDGCSECVEGFAGDHRFGAVALFARDPALEKLDFDAKASGEPLDGLAGWPGLPSLDLRDVLLGEAIARELAPLVRELLTAQQ